MRSLTRILRFTGSLWKYYAGVVASAMVVAVTSLAVPFVVGRATDLAVAGMRTEGHNVVPIIWLAVGLLALDLVNSVTTNVNGWLGDVMSARMRQILSSRYFSKLLSLPQSWFDEELTGSITSKLSRSITNVTDFAKAFANNFFTLLLTTVAVLVISAWYYWPLTVLLGIIFPVYVWLTALTSRHWQARQQIINEHIDTAGGRFQEVISQIRVVKSFVTERSEQHHFDEHYDRTVGTTREQSTHWHLMDTLRRAVLNVVFFAIYAIIFVQTARGVFSVGVMVMLIQLMAMARQPVQMMSYIIDNAQRAVSGSKDYFEVMETRPSYAPKVTDGSRPTRVSIAEDRPVVSFEDVSFSYDGKDQVLDRVGFTIGRGERVALVGESGGGKSTIVNLLLGLYPPGSGSIEVGGRATSQIPVDELRRSIGVVFQDPSLFSGTIRENIAYGSGSEVTEEQLLEAARKAFADRFVHRFPNGYDTLVGERGIKLSGGQKQRISIARAILKDAPVLVLDEATSALDTKSERWVQAGLESLMAGRTSLIIAHRLSTISSVDRIVTLDQGRIDEIGTPAELAVSGGIYAELLALQAAGSRADRKRLAKFGIRM
ncbi:ABC transporter ATP-binding protein [Acidipropionibacterium virtanenii]|uniref:Lipid A export ATP-binding/permease protein MsbA n=1 Tax=Acidipropionibacterium virtanenii TaxID=2057246 RepID=A0A344US15_9ACTN|nr:ABC transporter ATP-binding protein [Acidipropionibacterium virtanenii]AXE38063.1 Lipid A export ATP-binding/permease protein MsbA [Acidipropionibacterium virtanenii]